MGASLSSGAFSTSPITFCKSLRVNVLSPKPLAFESGQLCRAQCDTAWWHQQRSTNGGETRGDPSGHNDSTGSQSAQSVHRPVDAQERHHGQRGLPGGGHDSSGRRQIATKGGPARANQEERPAIKSTQVVCFLHCSNPRETAPGHLAPPAGEGDIIKSMSRHRQGGFHPKRLMACGGEL